MANIRKSFNFRNGVQVDNDNFVVNPNGLVGIGTTIPTELLDVRGTTKVSGLMTATDVHGGQLNVTGVGTIANFTDGIVQISSGIITSATGIVTFYGDGRGLTNIPTSQWVDVDVGLGFTSIYAAGNVGVGTTDPRFSFQIGGNPDVAGHEGVGINSRSGEIVSTGIITASEFRGTLRSSDLSGTIDDARLPNLITSNITGNVTGNLTGTADLARNLTGTPHVQVGVITATDVHTTNLDVTGIGTVRTLNATLQAQVGGGDNSVFAQSTGRLGIGTVTPGSELQIRKPSGTLAEIISDSGEARLSIGQRTGAGTSTGVIRFGSQDDTLEIINNAVGDVRFILDANPAGVNTGSFSWHRNSSATTLMLLDRDGNLGINETNPTEKLHVGGGITVTQNSFFDGTVKANKFEGDGAGITNIAIPDPITSNVFRQTGVTTIGQLHVLNDSLTGISSLGISTDQPISGLDAKHDIGLFSRIGINTESIGGYSLPREPNDIRFYDCRLQVAGEAKFDSVGIGSSARSALDLGNAVSLGSSFPSLILPSINNSQRDQIVDKVSGGSTVSGSLIFNTQISEFQGYTGIGWTTFGASDYSNADVDNHLNTGTANANEVLSWTGSDYDWVAQTGGGGGGTFASKNVSPHVATDGQTTFAATYTVGFVDVYLNGSKLAESEYTATTGTNIVLDEGAQEDDFIEIIGLESTLAGVEVQDGSVVVGTAGTIDFGTNLSVTPISAGIVTITATGSGGIPGISTEGTTELNHLFVSGISTLGHSNGIGTVTIGIGNTALFVDGEARVTGILTVGQDSVTIDGTNNIVKVGTGVTITGDGIHVTGVTTATSFVGDGRNLTNTLSSRVVRSGTTPIISNNAREFLEITGFKSYALMNVGLSTAGWIRIYTDEVRRQIDLNRSLGVDPAPGSGVIAEVVTTGINTSQLITPFVMGGNMDNPAGSLIYVTLQNLSGENNAITANLTILKLED